MNTLSIGEKAPNFEIKDNQGIVRKLSDYSAPLCGADSRAHLELRQLFPRGQGPPLEVFVRHAFR